MLNILQYDFMRKAILVGLLIGIMTPLIGITLVLRRLSLIGDSLSHTSLAGVAAGLAFGFNPVFGAVAASVIAALSIERIRRLFPKYGEISIAIIMSTGIGLAGILSGFAKNTSSFHSFLFGSIVAITDLELYVVIVLSGVVIVTLTLLYKELLFMTFEEEAARLAGVPIRSINLVFTVLMALTISISARTVGALVVSSLMVIPVALAMQIGKSYKQTMVISVTSGVSFVLVGLVISFYADLKPGATIVLVGVVTLLFAIIIKNVLGGLRLRKL